MRSYLLVAADDAPATALSSGADALVLDLGDWTKETGREAARAAAGRFLLRARDAPARPRLYALVAPVASTAIDADLEILVSAGADGVCLAEALGAASIEHLCAKLAVREAECGRGDGTTRILAMATQTPAAIFALGDYLGASRRLEALVFDTEPLRRALGAGADEPSLDPSTPFASARAGALLGAAAAGVAAIDRPVRNPADEARLIAECRAARRDGFAGKLAIHPRQIDAIRRA